MKIRGRLIIAFLIMTACPFVLMGVCSNLILSNQCSNLENSYQTSTSATRFVFNPLEILYTMTREDYNKLADIADNSPEELATESALKEINASVKSRDSFIVVRKDNRDYFIGNKKLYHQMNSLPSFGGYHKGVADSILIDKKVPVLVKSKDFYFEGHIQGQIFLITDLNKIIPVWGLSIKKLIFSLFLIILATALFLIVWLYSSIVRPLNILRLATMQIGAGHLDQPVRVTSLDEIGELCRDFEEMRICLKEMIEERNRYEQDTRDMITNMAHDLQTPLTSIKGYSEGILEGVANTPEKQTKYLKTIYAKATDMSYLVDELSVFAKVEQNSLPYHFIPINLDSYFTDCLDYFTLDLETQHVTIQYENSVAKDVKILADPEQLKRVINNIIGNAVKYLDKDQGHLVVRISDVPLPPPAKPLYRQINHDGSEVQPPQIPDQFVQVEIKDNGPGIAAADLPYIFNRFYRADASRNSAKRGSGLGLAIVSRIIEDHGGRVWARSTEGEGTSILFTLKKADN